jgi:inosine-uridine nucleoside N-ribohydrolase
MLYETGWDDIPVVLGRKTKEHYSNQFYWGEGFDKVKPIDQSAADFIIENLRKYPHEIILFTVGPVPNIADVLDKDPEVLKLTKKIYSMFGSFYIGYDKKPTPDKEWNVRADVEASRKFMSCGADIVFAGLDITGHVKFSQQNRLKLLYRQSPLTNAISGLNALWEYESRDPTLYDPVAIGMVLWPELFDTKRVHVSVTDDGYTVIDESKPSNCTIGTSIQTEKFLELIMNRYLYQNLGRDQ